MLESTVLQTAKNQKRLDTDRAVYSAFGEYEKQLLEKYEQEHDCAYLVITHDLQVASRLCEVIYEIEHGKIIRKAVR